MFDPDKWVKEHVGEHAKRIKGDYQKLASDKTSASWGCLCPIVEGFQFAWIQLSPWRKGGQTKIYYDYIELD